MSFRLPAALFLSAILLAAQAHAQFGRQPSAPGRKYTALERMAPERLKAATEDAERHQAGRQAVQLQSGYNDYHAIMHAHAEDSSHTGGTRPEMLADAKKVGVDCIFLTDHFRPPNDFMDTWRGLHDGVLFVPGSETHGFLIHPMESMMDEMNLDTEGIIEAVTRGDGLIFLSHLEARFDHPMDGLTGIEMYNRHFDAMQNMMVLFSLPGIMLDPERYAETRAALEAYPDAMFAMQCDYPVLYTAKWDEETQHQRVVGIAANDCHHNNVIQVRMVDAETVLLGTNVDSVDSMREFKASGHPGILEMTQGREPGDILAELDFDPYHISFRNSSTHILAAELTEEAMREALSEGRAYVSHDWLCDPAGFVFGAKRGGEGDWAALMGAEIPYEDGLVLLAEFPAECDIRLLKDGEEVHNAPGREFRYEVQEAGVYRIEGWLPIDDEERPWIYSNPVYLR